ACTKELLFMVFFRSAWIRFLSRSYSFITIFLVGLGTGSLLYAEDDAFTEGQRFLDVCEHFSTLEDLELASSIEAILNQLGTTDCVDAYARLKQIKHLNLSNTGFSRPELLS